MAEHVGGHRCWNRPKASTGSVPQLTGLGGPIFIHNPNSCPRAMASHRDESSRLPIALTGGSPCIVVKIMLPVFVFVRQVLQVPKP